MHGIIHSGCCLVKSFSLHHYRYPWRRDADFRRINRKKVMKDMVGGCCVCADESGWAENPLVYCDGPSCNVAVHQGCYGILNVPEGNWYCARCSAGNDLRTPAQCELCSMKDGALKRTDQGGWAHVICALYIPEVQFGDVHSMDPVVLSEVPEDRYNKVCYICESKGNDKSARIGACMECNKPGCKKYFHVTCAQQKGMLCEEGGGSKNVKYCGYCSHHFKKVQNDPGVKVVPAYRPVKVTPSIDLESRNSVPGLQMHREKRKNDFSNSFSNAISGATEYCDSKDNIVRLEMNCADSPIGISNSFLVSEPSICRQNGPSPSPASVSRISPAVSANNVCSQKVSVLQSGEEVPVVSCSVASSVSVTLTTAGFSPSCTSLYCPPTTNTAMSLTLANSQCRHNTSAFSCMEDSVHIQQSSSAGPMGTGSPDSCSVPIGASGKDERPLAVANDLRHKRCRTKGEEDGRRSKKPRRISTKKTVKSLLESVSSVVDETVSSFQAERVAAAASNAGQQPPYPIATFSTTPLVSAAVPGTSTSGQHLNSIENPLPVITTLASNTNYAQSGVVTAAPLKPVPKLGLTEGNQPALPTSLEQLLERQWEQGSQFLMKQAEHFDIASLLSCLHQLKVENQRLEENIVTLAGRRDHLLAVNARLSLALGQNQQSPHSPRLNPTVTHSQQQDASTEASPSSALSHLRSLTTTISPASQGSQAKSAQTQAQTCSTQVLSPVGRSSVSGTGVGGASPVQGFGSGSGVFTSVARQQQKGSTSESSPDRAGTFLMPQTPTPLLASGTSTSSLAALTPQYSALSHQDQVMQLMALQQQAALNAAAMMQQPASPHRTASSLASVTSLSQSTSTSSSQKS